MARGLRMSVSICGSVAGRVRYPTRSGTTDHGAVVRRYPQQIEGKAPGVAPRRQPGSRLHADGGVRTLPPRRRPGYPRTVSERRSNDGERLHCPCCGESCLLAEQPALLAAEQAARRRHPDGSEVLARARRTDWPQWACADCLAAGRALLADVTKQSGIYDGPHVAYLPVRFDCHDCGQPFTFTPQRQREWYERHGRYVGKHPTRCDTCGPRHGARVRLEKALAAALARLDRRDPAALMTVAELYAALGLHAKSDEHARQARNRARDTDHAVAIEARITALSRRDPNLA